MTFRRSHRIFAGTLAIATLLTGGMALREPDSPTRMSAMRIASLDGYSVSDWNGALVGRIASVETDDQGRTRWLNVDLGAGRIARIASFRADLDAAQRTVRVRLPEGLMRARAT